MERTLKILLLEDSSDDATLIEHELRRAGLSFHCYIATDRAEFVSALEEYRPDIIISDHSLPNFNSIEAFAICKEREQAQGIVIPFILVTGNVSEEFAIQSIKTGIDDYILKDRLKRLPMAIHGALEKSRIESERRKYLEQVIAREALMNEAEYLAGFGSWDVDLRTGKHTWSDATYSIYGFKPGEIEPDYETFLNLVHPEDRPRLERGLSEMFASEDDGEDEFRIVNPNGAIKRLACKFKVQRNSEGIPVRLVGFNLDVTERTIADSALKREEQKYRSLFYQNPDAVFSLDLEWRFTDVNEAFINIVGLPIRELIGRDFREILSSELRSIYDGFISGRNRGQKRYRTHFTNRLGKTFVLDVTVMDTVVDDQIIGVHCVAKDISDTMRLETLLDQAYRTARIGGWEVDVTSNKLSWTAMTRELHQVSDDFVPTIESARSFYCDESTRQIQDAMTGCIENGQGWDLELKITTGKGNRRWVRCIGQPDIRDGKCVRVFGTFQDIDNRKRAEEKTRDAHREKISILESIGDGFFAVDGEWNVSYCNRVAESYLQIPRDQVLGRNIWTVFSKAVKLAFYEGAKRAMKENVAVHFEEFNPTAGTWFSVNVYPSKSGLSVYLKDISDQKKHLSAIELQNSKLREIARIQSHEVRAPLARLIGLVNLINDEMHEMKELPELLENIAVSALELDALIREIVRKTESFEPSQVL